MVPAGDMGVGTNLENIVDWSSAWTFKDAMLGSRPWVSHAFNEVTGLGTWEGGGLVHLDEKGWPTTLNEWTNDLGQPMKQHLGTLMFREIDGRFPAGMYRAEWEGTGELVWKFAAKLKEQGRTPDGKQYALIEVTPNNDGIYLGLRKTSPTDPIRNIHLWLPDYQGQSFAGQTWKPGADFSPFHPAFLEKLKPFTTLRFMDWAQTNNSDVESWTDLKPFDYATQADWTVHNGIAPEYMIELCNELKVNGWFNMPHRADDDFVRRFATLVRDTLDPSVKAYVEWSNEVWNWGADFHAFHWVNQQLALPENAMFQMDRWAFEAREIEQDFSLWSEVFAGQSHRLVRVVAGHQANSWIMEQILSHLDGQFDAISCAAYLTVSEQARNQFTATSTPREILQALAKNVPNSLAGISNHQKIAAKYSQLLGRTIEFAAYEGGPQLDPWGAPYQTGFFETGFHPQMYDLYTLWLNAVRSQGLNQFVHFSLTGGLHQSPYGSFGALKAINQIPAQAPKYLALVDFIRGKTSIPQISVETTQAIASEQGPTPGKWLISRSGPANTAIKVNFRLGGTASKTDYSGLPATLVFQKGESIKHLNITPVDDSLVESREEVQFQILAGVGYQIDATRAAGTITIQDNDLPPPAQGLAGFYFAGTDFANLVLSRVDPAIQFTWGNGSPDARVPSDHFSVRWLGQLVVPVSGRFQFRTFTDEGVRLWINGVEQIRTIGQPVPTYATTPSFVLTRGQVVDVRMEYQEKTGASQARLEWRLPGQSFFSAIPTQVWSPIHSSVTAIKPGPGNTGRVGAPDWFWMLLQK